MEAALALLERTCREAAAHFQDIPDENTDLAFSRLDSKSWRSRVDDVARAIEFSGSAICLAGSPESEPSIEAAYKLVDLVAKLVDETQKIPASRGRHFLRFVCDAATATVAGLAKLPLLLQRQSGPSIEPYQWNHTARLRELPRDAVEFLNSRWERWNSQVREAVDEINQIVTGDLSHERDVASRDEASRDEATRDEATRDEATRDEATLIDGDEWIRHAHDGMNTVEFAMAEDCESLAKLGRTLMRKMRLRCINTALPSSPVDLAHLDLLYPLGLELVASLDDLAASLIPPHDNSVIATCAVRFAKTVHGMLEVARQRCDEQHVIWFDNCSVQVDRLLQPIVDRNPMR